MSTLAQLKERSQDSCELCKGTNSLQIFEVPLAPSHIHDTEIYICNKCEAQINKKEDINGDHWKILSDTMWSEYPAVQVTAWRMLQRLKNDSWAADLLDMLYLDEENEAWARATGDHENDATVDLHRDSNGAVLQTGDSVVLIKSLDVKGSTVNARLGTVVKNIRLVPDNTEQIEGKIEGQTIVILTKYLRKQNAEQMS